MLSLFDEEPQPLYEGADDAAERRALIGLTLVPNVGAGRMRTLVGHFGSAGAVFAASPRALAQVEGVGPQTVQALAAFDAWDAVEAQVRQAERVGADLVTYWDAGYPAALKEIYDAPAILWVRGDLRPEDARSIAVVGTRKPSAYGSRVAHGLAAALAERGLTVVSGLAYGIDTAAHEGALEAGGRTLAVLGSGVDVIYPAKNSGVVRRMLEHGQGAVLSEFPLGTKPNGPNFPARNRILAGLTLGTLVVESKATGGGMLTAYLALEQNREVFAVPSAIDNVTGEGPNRLIQRGLAKLVLGVDDLLEELGEGQPGKPTSPAEVAPPPMLNSVERQLYEVLTAEAQHIDTICERTGLNASTVLSYLLSLEMQGLVRQMAGRQFFRA